MYPRLKLLHRLLADDGVFFVSIDDNELASLRLVLDEIFGASNFLSNVVWQKRTSPDARLNLGPAHDHIVVYAKRLASAKERLNKVPLSIGRTKDFKNPDLDRRGLWASVDLTGQTGHATKDQFYEINTPSGKKLLPPAKRCWALSETSFLALDKDKRIWFGKNGNSRPRLKKFLSESEGSTVWTWWTNEEVGHNQEATKELLAILGEDSTFETPKPTRLIERILQLATDKNSLVLDSFAGSGTTAHAVLKLNAQDTGTRRFILIETMDYAETITAERVRRVMSGYGDGSKAVIGLGGGFDYYTVGERLLLDDGMLNRAVGLPAIRDYVAWTEGIPIGQCTPLVPLETEGNASSPSWMGEAHGLGLFFVWDDTNPTTLDLSLLTQLVKRPGRYLIYADQCALGEDFMRRHNITYKKIPRDITRL